MQVGGRGLWRIGRQDIEDFITRVPVRRGAATAGAFSNNKEKAGTIIGSRHIRRF